MSTLPARDDRPGLPVLPVVGRRDGRGRRPAPAAPRVAQAADPGGGGDLLHQGPGRRARAWRRSARAPAARTARSAGPAGRRRSWSWARSAPALAASAPCKRGKPEAVALDEPDRLAEACARLGLKHVVITSVTRDDLPDGGAEHFRRCILAVRARTGATIEVLTPDFDGRHRRDRHRPLGRARGLQPQPGDRRPAPAARPPQEPVRRQPGGPRARQGGPPRRSGPRAA